MPTNHQRSAESLLGQITWLTLTTGYCRCPGEARHTHTTGKKDCRVSIDGAPTVYCFHESCKDHVAAVNLALRRMLATAPREVTLPPGRILRSGPAPGRLPPPAPGSTPQLEAIRREAAERRSSLIEEFAWPYDRILADSPIQVADRSPQDQFRLWLKLWPPHASIWIGDVTHSGKPEHAAHFRSIPDWFQVGPAMGNFTCGACFRAGAFSRSDEAIESREFLIVESDTLTRDEVGAVFRILNARLQYRLHCIIDTGGKSLHAWFSPPPRDLELKLKAGLAGLGCDPKLFTPSQPVRVPGAYRQDRLQRLIWLRE